MTGRSCEGRTKAGCPFSKLETVLLAGTQASRLLPAGGSCGAGFLPLSLSGIPFPLLLFLSLPLLLLELSLTRFSLFLSPVFYSFPLAVFSDLLPTGRVSRSTFLLDSSSADSAHLLATQVSVLLGLEALSSSVQARGPETLLE